jgi:hypothetical protein
MDEDVKSRIEDLDKRFDSTEKRIDDIKWFIGGATGLFTLQRNNSDDDLELQYGGNCRSRVPSRYEERVGEKSKCCLNWNCSERMGRRWRIKRCRQGLRTTVMSPAFVRRIPA